MPVQPRSAIDAGFAVRRRLDTTRKLLGLGQRGIVSPQQGPPAQAPTPGPVAAPQAKVAASVEAPVAEGGEAPPRTRGQMVDAIQATLNQVTALKVSQAIASGQIGPKRGSHDWNLDQIRQLMDYTLPVRARDGINSRR